MSNRNFLKEKLIKLQGKIETIKLLEQAKGENFNLFSILGMERLEVQTHSAFIYELINASGSHSQGDTYLRLFIQNVLKEKNFEYENVIVKREDNYPGEGRIDFTIENEQMFIAIEMKIDAKDQKDQMDRYTEISKRKNKGSKVYYLTLEGRDSKENYNAPINNKGTDKKKEYENLSFSSDILNWIELCIEKSAKLPVLRENLVQYAKLIKKLTNKTSEEITMELISMIDNPEIAEAATVMSQNLGLAWATREAKFWVELIDKIEADLEKLGWDSDIAKPYDTIFYEKDNEIKNTDSIAVAISNHRKKKDNDIGILFWKKIENNEITLQLYQYNSDDDLMFQLDEIENTSSEDLTELVKELGLKQGKKTSDGYGETKLNINFYGYRMNDSEPTYDLFDDEKLEQMVDKTKKKVLEKLNIIDKYFKKTGKKG